MAAQVAQVLEEPELAVFLTPQASTASPPVMAARSPGTPAASPPAEDTPSFTQGPGVGAIAVLHGLAEYLGIVGALGDDREGRLALWQVIARALDQGSRLSAVRLARSNQNPSDNAEKTIDIFFNGKT